MSPRPTDAILAALVRREPIHAPVAVVVAHPDDETIGAGASLHLLRNLLLIHVTDGAPRDLRDAQAAGFASCGAYAAARRAELQAALQIGAVRTVNGLPTTDLPIADQSAAFRLAWLKRELAR